MWVMYHVNKEMRCQAGEREDHLNTRYMQTIGGKILQMDHCFKNTKRVKFYHAGNKQKRAFGGQHTVMNEFGQVASWRWVDGTSLEELKLGFEKMIGVRYKMHKFPPVEVVYVDNPTNDESTLVECIFDGQGEAAMDETHGVVEELERLPMFQQPIDSKRRYISSLRLFSTALTEIEEELEKQIEGFKNKVGCDIEWTPEKAPLVGTVQIAVLSGHSWIFHLTRALAGTAYVDKDRGTQYVVKADSNAGLRALKSFLEDERIEKGGVNIANDVTR